MPSELSSESVCVDYLTTQLFSDLWPSFQFNNPKKSHHSNTNISLRDLNNNWQKNTGNTLVSYKHTSEVNTSKHLENEPNIHNAIEATWLPSAIPAVCSVPGVSHLELQCVRCQFTASVFCVSPNNAFSVLRTLELSQSGAMCQPAAIAVSVNEIIDPCVLSYIKCMPK